jgi:tetratricopeptide (TPR) repeat protein
LENQEAMRAGGNPLLADVRANTATCTPSSGDGDSETFDSLVYEARCSHDWAEYARALTHYRRALEAAPEDLSSLMLANILEAMGRAKEGVKHCADEVARLEMEAASGPFNPTTKVGLGVHLAYLGRTEQANRHLLEALPFLQSLEPRCHIDCLYQIGWRHYRRSEFREALGWFERATRVEPGDDYLAAICVQSAKGGKLLALSKLGLESEARRAAKEYVSRHGRLSRPVRDALMKINVDADALYIEHISVLM